MTPPHTYPTDIGNAHIIDYYLRIALRDVATYGAGFMNYRDGTAVRAPSPEDFFSPEDWSRYDGDLL